jgi:putative ABC transport system permease protein
VNLQDVLKDSARGSAGAGRWGRNLLVVGQVALAVMLLSGAGLLIRSVSGLLNEDTGVTTRTALTTDIQLSDVDYAEWPRVAAFYAQLLENLRAQPGIARAGSSNFQPLELGWRLPYTIEGDAPVPTDEAPLAQAHTVDEEYFATLGVRMLAGRDFDARDDADNPSVVVINEAFARRAFQGRDALGARLVVGARQIGPLGARITAGNTHEIVGIVADVKNTSLRDDAEPAIFFAVRQFPFRRMYIAAVGPASPARLLAAIREQVRALDPSVPLGEVRTMDRVLAESADPPRFVMLVMSAFAALALLLAAVGIHGVLSFVVNRRRREIGIRMALGARPRDVLASVLGEGLGLAVAGAIVGVVAAALGARALGGLLYGVRPADPLALSLALSVVLIVTLAACLLPGMRAAATEPMQTLRSE